MSEEGPTPEEIQAGWQRWMDWADNLQVDVGTEKGAFLFDLAGQIKTQARITLEAAQIDIFDALRAANEGWQRLASPRTLLELKRWPEDPDVVLLRELLESFQPDPDDPDYEFDLEDRHYRAQYDRLTDTFPDWYLPYWIMKTLDDALQLLEAIGNLTMVYEVSEDERLERIGSALGQIAMAYGVYREKGEQTRSPLLMADTLFINARQYLEEREEE